MLDDNNIKRSGGINLPDDMHVDRYSVPGGWIYIVSVEREENGKNYTSCVSTCYVPGRR